MKCLIAYVAFYFCTVAFSAPSVFRINKNSAGQNCRFAAAWGIPGQAIDFEEIERSEKVDEFLEQNHEKFVNYLVDIKTNKIVTTLQIKRMGKLNVSGRLGYRDLTTHPFNLDTQCDSLSANGKQYELVMVSSTGKKHSYHEELYLLEKTGTLSHETFKVSAVALEIITQIDRQVESKLTKEQKQIFNNSRTYYSYKFRAEVDPRSKRHQIFLEVHISTETHHSDPGEFSIRSKFRLLKKSKALILKLVDQKIEK